MAETSASATSISVYGLVRYPSGLAECTRSPNSANDAPVINNAGTPCRSRKATAVSMPSPPSPANPTSTIARSLGVPAATARAVRRVGAIPLTVWPRSWSTDCKYRLVTDSSSTINTRSGLCFWVAGWGESAFICEKRHILRLEGATRKDPAARH